MARSWRSGGGIIVFSLTIFGILFSFSSRGVGATGVAQVTDGAISGRVMSASGSPVVNASLSLLTESNLVLTTTADAEGRFRFDHLAPGRYRLDAAGLGLSPVVQEVTVSAGQAQEVYLTLPPIALERVMVIGHPSNVGTIPGSAHFIGEQELAGLKRGGTDDIHNFVRQVPGVNIQEEDGYGLRPNIGMRGSGSDRSSKITLMEDGVLIAPAPYAAPSAYYFPTAGRMESLEVRKGSSQIKYGPRTNGGVLNLISSSIPSEFNLKTSLSAGADSVLRLTAKLGSSAQNFGWIVETYQIENDGFKQLDGGGNTGFEVEDYLAKFRVKTSPTARAYQELELKLGRTDQVSHETYLGLTDADFERTPFRRYAASQEDLFSSAHAQYQVRHLFAIPRLDVTTVVYRNNFRRNWVKLQSIGGASLTDVVERPEMFAAELAIARGADSGPGALMVRHNNRTYYGAGVQSILGLPLEAGGARQKLEIGFRYHEDQEDRFQHEDRFQMLGGRMALTAQGAPGSQSNRVSDARAWATFIQDTIEWGRWSLMPGLRYERVTLTRTDYAKTDPSRTSPTMIRENLVDVFIPGVGVSFAVSPAVRLFGGVHKGFSPPAPGSTESTDAEESVNYELGVRVQRTSLHAEVVTFYNDYDNLLGRDTLAAGGTGEGDLFNGGEARVYGLEASASWDMARLFRVGSALPVRVAYTLTDAEFGSRFDSAFGPWGQVAVGDELPYIPTHQLFASVGVNEADWSVQLDAVYVGEMRTQAGQGPMARREATDPFLVFNLSGEHGLTPGTSLFASLQNLANRSQIVARRPAGARPGAPRLFMAGIRVDLGR